MTEIRIDNRPVAIGDTTFELVAYNPLADETADHTYDIDIDLSIPANAAALGHIGRLDRDLAAAWGEYRSGAVLADGRTIISGRAYLLSIADGRAKVQIVAEDHARRYTEDDEDSDTAFASGNRRIDTLLADTALPDEPAHLTAPIWRYTYRAYTGYAAAWTDPEDRWTYPATYGDREAVKLRFLRHPRLVDTVEAAFEAAGYTIEADFLRNNDLAMRLRIISLSRSDKWGDHLPPWSLAYLARQVERLANAQVFVDDTVHTVRIDSLTGSVAETADIEAFDDWEMEVEDEGFNAYDNVSYDLPDTRFYREADLSEDQVAAFRLREISRDGFAVNMGDTQSHTLYEIYDQTYNDNRRLLGHCVIYGPDSSDDDTPLASYPAAVQNYQHTGDPEADNVIELAIVPAEHVCVYHLEAYDEQERAEGTVVPVGCEYDKEEAGEQQDKSNYAIIQEGIDREQPDNGQPMRVASYADDDDPEAETFHSDFGTGANISPKALNVPFVITSDQYTWDKDSLYLHYSITWMLARRQQSLTLDNLAREFRWGYNIEVLRSRHRYKVRAQWPWTERLQQFRVRCRGKHFVIYSVKHTLTERGFDPVAEIEMYPIDD